MGGVAFLSENINYEELRKYFPSVPCTAFCCRVRFPVVSACFLLEAVVLAGFPSQGPCVGLPLPGISETSFCPLQRVRRASGLLPSGGGGQGPGCPQGQGGGPGVSTGLSELP